MELSLAIIIAVAAVILSGLFSGSEIAFVQSSKVRREIDAARGGVVDRIIGRFSRHEEMFISHLLDSCRLCQDILVFDKGQVVQRGSHEELERQDGLYRELWNAQAQYYET